MIDEPNTQPLPGDPGAKVDTPSGDVARAPEVAADDMVPTLDDPASQNSAAHPS
jgi:hypothetical protein